MAVSEPDYIDLTADSPQPSQEISQSTSRSKKRKRSTALEAQPIPQTKARRADDAPAEKDRNILAQRAATRSRSTSPNLFYVDTVPAELPKSLFVEKIIAQVDSTLSLPPHVYVYGTEASPNLPIPEVAVDGVEEEDYIEYLDFDDRKDVKRYFEEDVPSKPIKILCKLCGGEHKAKDCRVLICMTCGIRNEHITPQCPISKTCYRCRRKGHITANCPNPRVYAADNYCERCGSENHTDKECPSIWRLYIYMADDARNETLKARQLHEGQELGQGGEAFIAEDAWCYNCGGCGHWGDDCSTAPHPYDHPAEHSPFSNYGVTTGPFHDVDDAQNQVPSTSAAATRVMNTRAEDEQLYNVGKRGRARDAERLRAQQDVKRDDVDDWFSKRKPPSGPRRGNDSGPKKITFGASITAAKPSLIDRISNNPNTTTQGGAQRPGNQGSDRDKNNRRKERDWDKGKRHNRPNSSRSHDSGPRYKGGYSR